MNPRRLDALLRGVRDGRVTPERAREALKQLPFEDLGVARVDHHRELRTGHPEVVLAQGKTDAQVQLIARRIVAAGSDLLITRVSPKLGRALKRRYSKGRWNEAGRIFGMRHNPTRKEAGNVLVLTAGTADVPVAEEAAFTLEFLGNHVERVYDVGVAGLHRLLAHRERLDLARAIIVVAGMEGALASVVGGLARVPILAVPTSTGYGASLGGLAALLAMLNSCAAGVSVVNIDNGFGAAMCASRINLGMDASR